MLTNVVMRAVSNELKISLPKYFFSKVGRIGFCKKDVVNKLVRRKKRFPLLRYRLLLAFEVFKIS